MIAIILLPAAALAQEQAHAEMLLARQAPEPTDDEILLARLIYAEARGETREGMMLVAQVALDRLSSGIWGDTLSKVIRAKGQFARLGSYNDECLETAQAALDGERYRDDMKILYFQVTKSTKDWYAPWLGFEGGHAYYGEREKEDAQP